MSWGEPDPAIRILGQSPDCRPVPLTSVAVIRVPRARNLSTGAIRLYGIEAGDVDEAFNYTSSDCATAMSASEQADYDPVYRQEATPCTSSDVYEITFTDTAPTRDEPLLWSTCIPKHRGFPTYYYSELDYLAPSENNVSGAAIAYYDGPDVLRLPDGRWLMLLHCYTTLIDTTSFSSSIASYGELRAALAVTPECSFTDIVAYVADDAGFQYGLSGPYCIVRGRDALPDDEITPAGWTIKPRMFVSVPSGVIFGSYLYVYYVISRACTFDDSLGCDGTAPVCATGTIQGDAYAARTDFNTAFDDVGLPRSAIACKRILVDDLLTFLDGNPAEQWMWEESAVAAADPSVEGDLLGRVRVWVSSTTVADPTDMTGALNFEDVMCTTSGLGSIIDPAGATCSSAYNAALLLFFSHSGCQDAADIGSGLWVAKAITETDAITPADGTVIDVLADDNFGKHFFIPVEWPTTPPTVSSDYQITDKWEVVTYSRSGYAGEYQNPAVLQRANGDWWVFSGGGGFFSYGITSPYTTHSFARLSNVAASGFCVV